MKETLEEAEKEFEKLINGKGLPTKQLLEVAEHYFIVGYEIAKERSYSEEDMKLAYKTGARLALISQSDLALCKGKFPTLDEWFNEFKKT